jgi:DNA-directed RNA polymerase specialized sigma24 family protein
MFSHYYAFSFPVHRRATLEHQEMAMANKENNGSVLMSGYVSEQDSVLELYQTAALILGSQDEAVEAVERTVASVEADPCAEPTKAQQESRELLIRIALERAIAMDPLAFKPATLDSGPDLCIDTDDLETTGVTVEQLTHLVSGSGKTRLREWLEHLQPDSRVVFVMRAMMGKDSASVAAELRRANGGPGWTAEHVGRVFRGALCSLASSLVHAPVAS